MEREGLRGYLQTIYSVLGEALYAQGQYAEAERIAHEVQLMQTIEDAETEIGWRKLLGKVLARRDEDGEEYARAAVEIAASTDMLDLTGDALSDLAYVLGLTGEREKTMSALEHASALYENKGNLVSERRTRALLKESALSPTRGARSALPTSGS